MAPIGREAACGAGWHQYRLHRQHSLNCGPYEDIPGFFAAWIPFYFLVVSSVLDCAAAGRRLRTSKHKRTPFTPQHSSGNLWGSVPTFIVRADHSALCSHFLILLAIGLYFYIVRKPQVATIIAGGIVMLSSLLANPYIMYMVIAVLCAAPLTLLIRREKAWIPVAIGVAAEIAVTGCVALVLGYGEALPMPGFGYYSMNLWSPLYPCMSSIFRGITAPLDATGGQYEGYQYLGLAVILLLLVADFCLRPSDKMSLFKRHGGVVVVCMAMTLLALSTTIYAGHYLLVNLQAPGWLLQFRTSGRFFWPVAYFLIIAGIAIFCRTFTGRAAGIILLALALVQFAETSILRRGIRHRAHTHDNWELNTTELRPLLARHTKLTVLPKFLCGADQFSAPFAQLFLLASEVELPVNTMYVSRYTKAPTCSSPETPIEVRPKELLIFLPEHNVATVLLVADWRDICRQLGVLVVCSQELRQRVDLPTPAVPLTPIGKELSTSTKGIGAQALGFGWFSPEPWGVWSDGPAAQLIADISDASNKPILLTVWAHALAFHPERTQEVAVFASGRLSAVWNINEAGDAEYKALVMPGKVNQPLIIEFQVRHPVTPRHNGLGPDDRKLGIGLVRFRLDPKPS